MKISVVSGLIAALIGLTPVAASAQSSIYIPLISKGFQHQFWQAVKVGAVQASKDYKVTITFEGPESETMVDKQIDMLSAVLAKKPQALGFAALDSEAAAPLLKKAQAEHIPVIGFDSGVKSDIPVTTCATDNLAAAALAADKMAELIGKSGEVAVIAADQTGKSNIDRRDGFVNEMKNKYPNVKVVDVQYGGDLLQASEATKSIILAHPNLKGIFGANEGCANGVANGIRELGKAKKLVAIGFDSGKAQIDNVKSGLLAGSITQNPVGMGYKTVEAAVKALKGEKLPKIIDTGFFWYDAKNYTKPEIAAVLYQ